MEWRVEQFDEIDSTNAYLSRAADKGAQPGLVAVTSHQNTGRGRLQRQWHDEPDDGLLFSVLLAPDTVGHATRALAVAVVEVVSRRIEPTAVGIKWPNDVVVDDRKLAGILGETITRGGAVTTVVVGCGLNLIGVPKGLEARASHLQEWGGEPIDRAALLLEILDELDVLLRNPDRTASGFRRRCSTIGRQVKIEGRRTVEGTAVDVTDSGALSVESDDGEVHEVTLGDVDAR